MKKFLGAVAIIIVIVLAGYFAGKYLDTVQTNANNVNKNEVKNVVNQVGNKITNSVKNTAHNTTKNETENVIGNTVTNDVEEEKETEMENEKVPAVNVGQTGEDDRQKAINMAKKEWGEDNNVSFKIDEQSEDGKFVISVVDKNTTKVVFWYSVDIKNNTIEEK